MASRLRIGVVGFSRKHFDEDEARAALRECVDLVLRRAHLEPEDAELVSGLTNQGVPRLAYELARELGMRTVGVSARQALRARAGQFPVDEKVIVGERYGDESGAFLDRIDVLIRVGGGPQSRRETEEFKARLAARGAGIARAAPGGPDGRSGPAGVRERAPSIDEHVLEREVTWHGPR